MAGASASTAPFVLLPGGRRLDGRAAGGGGETPIEGVGAIRRWVALLDVAEVALADPRRDDSYLQRKAGRLLDSLFLYEHQMTPRARRRAREYVWRRDHPGRELPPAPLHRPGEPSPEPCCVCSACRDRWALCWCRACRLARRTGITSRATTLSPMAGTDMAHDGEGAAVPGAPRAFTLVAR